MKALTKFKNRISKISIADIIGKVFTYIGILTFILFILFFILIIAIVALEEPDEYDHLDHDTCQCY